MLTLICMVMSAAVQTAAPPVDPPPGFTALFNGENLDGWWGLGTEDPARWMALAPEELDARRARSRAALREHWRVENGELVNDGAGPYLTTNANYGDFELRLEYRTVPGADSGVYLRGVPQVQIWDTTEAGGKWGIGAEKGSGGLWNNTAGTPGKDPLVHADRPFGEWNSVRIVMIGERVTVHLNERLVVDHARLENYFNREAPLPRTGPIQLQTHGGEIRWRNVFIREIGAAEANATLEAKVAERFADGRTRLFNGRDLTGWTGATDHYEVVDGAIRCKAGRGGVLYTEDVYDDFVVSMEILQPPGGNNGLAIRYPGHGDPAYSGMCELQVLENTHPKYANLDPRQYHGSAYGMAAAHRGFLRPPGEWNHQVVIVRGGRITVELNGVRILDVDLDAVDTFMTDADRFAGRGLRRGAFGFAGHSDPVAYRRLWMTPARAH